MAMTDEERKKRRSEQQMAYLKRTNYEASKRSQKKNDKTYTFKVSKNLDKDLIEFLDNLDNRNLFIKTLIREKMKEVIDKRNTL